MSEAVDHPKHYGGADDPYEAIKVIEAWGLNFSLGSVVKYVARHGKKPGEEAVQDLRKAAWYCTREADRLEAARKNVQIVISPARRSEDGFDGNPGGHD